MDGYELEPDATARAEIMEAVNHWVERFLASRPTAPAIVPGGDLDRLDQPPSPDGRPIDDVLDTFARAIAPGFDTAAPGFLSYIPSGGLFTSAIGSFLGAVTNQYTGASHASPGAVALEQSVIDWMTRLFGLPDTAGGVLLSGGSLSNQTAVVAARERFGHDFPTGVIYTSVLAHSSIAKAARLAGFRPDQIRTVAVDDRARIDLDALRAALADDASAGRRPVMIAATAGTTDLGSIDPLDACATVAADAGCWFHVDAAYGGFFQLTDRGRARFRGIERADSITLDAHKSLFVPFGIGCLLVRDRNTLIDAHSDYARGAVMQDVPSTETPHYFALGPELTRPYRGLAVWLPLAVHGVDRFRQELDRMLDLAERTAAEIDRLPGVSLVLQPELSVVAFKADAGDDETRLIHDHIVDSGAIHLSSTTIDDGHVIRIAFLNQRTTDATATQVLDLVAEATRA